MDKWHEKKLIIGGFVTKTPIIQGGMGVGISLSGLAAAVANEGGIGVIATPAIGMNEPDYKDNFLEANIRGLRKEIRKARSLSDGIIGVNIMMALSNFADMVKTAIEEKIDIIFVGAGLPLNLPSYLPKDSHTKIVPIVSSGRAANLIMKTWEKKYNYTPDAIVVEGPKAGGHLGFAQDQINDPKFALENIIVDVLEVTKAYEEKTKVHIPVIAAGGIYTGEDIYKFIQLGADGVQMGTRFVTTNECDADMRYKQTYLDAVKEDVTIVKSPVGMPGRALRNKFIKDVEDGKRKPINCPYHCIITCDPDNSPYCIALALMNAQKGRVDNGLIFAGENVYRADKITSVHDLVSELATEYDMAVSINKETNKPKTKVLEYQTTDEDVK